MKEKQFLSSSHKKTAFLLDPEDQFKLFKKIILPKIRKKVGAKVSAFRVGNKIELIVNGHIKGVDLI